jgi:hypothetical protein
MQAGDLAAKTAPVLSTEISELASLVKGGLAEFEEDCARAAELYPVGANAGRPPCHRERGRVCGGLLRQRDADGPGVAVRVANDGVAPAVRLVLGGLEDASALLAGARFDFVGVEAEKAELGAKAP